MRSVLSGIRRPGEGLGGQAQGAGPFQRYRWQQQSDLHALERATPACAYVARVRGVPEIHGPGCWYTRSYACSSDNFADADRRQFSPSLSKIPVAFFFSSLFFSFLFFALPFSRSLSRDQINSLAGIKGTWSFYFYGNFDGTRISV